MNKSKKSALSIVALSIYMINIELPKVFESYLNSIISYNSDITTS